MALAQAGRTSRIDTFTADLARNSIRARERYLRTFLGVPADLGLRLSDEDLRAIYQSALSRLDSKLDARRPRSALLQEFVGDDRDIANVKLVEHLFATKPNPLPAWLQSPENSGPQ